MPMILRWNHLKISKFGERLSLDFHICHKIVFWKEFRGSRSLLGISATWKDWYLSERKQDMYPHPHKGCHRPFSSVLFIFPPNRSLSNNSSILLRSSSWQWTVNAASFHWLSDGLSFDLTVVYTQFTWMAFLLFSTYSPLHRPSCFQRRN